jgi:MarR family transcriptional regulator, organic hydroperoxide resistance regulator
VNPISNATATDVAAGLLDVLPRLLRRLRADVPLVPEGAEADPQWQGLAELRGANGQVALMSILEAQGRATMQDLASQLGVTPATVTMMVKRLLAQGYVERGRDENDWRLVWVSPTERGRQAICFYNQERQASLRRRLARLDERECAALEAALPALRHLVEVDLSA